MTRRSNFTIDRNRNRRRLLQGSGALAGLAALGELPLRAFGSGRVETPYGGARSPRPSSRAGTDGPGAQPP